MRPATAEPISHGGDLDAARERYPGAPEPWIDLSTGINPIPFPIPKLPAEIWSRLPARSEEEALLAAAAARYRVPDSWMIAAASGTQALIQLLPRLVPTSRVEILGPTYEEHEACWTRQGHRVSVVKDLDQSESADVVIVVNPDNPTGRVIPVSRLRTVATALARKNGLLIVDEVSGPALQIGKAALSDPHWLAATTARLRSDQQRLDAVLDAAGFTVLGGTPLFRLARHVEAIKLAEQLGRHGIHVRSFPREPQWLRFGLPADKLAWDRLTVALLSE